MDLKPVALRIDDDFLYQISFIVGKAGSSDIFPVFLPDLNGKFLTGISFLQVFLVRFFPFV